MKAKKIKGLDPSGPLVDNAEKIVATRLEELRSFSGDALVEENIQHQHDMRIAAKRLRYVLELTGFCFGEAGDVGLRAARELQQVLGDLRDCDEMLIRIERDFPGQGEELLEVVASRRSSHFRKFAETWAKLDARGEFAALVPSDDR